MNHDVAKNQSSVRGHVTYHVTYHSIQTKQLSVVETVDLCD